MSVPYTFATQTATIPLSELDTNFATPITLGSTAMILGNTYGNISGLTLTSPTLTTPTLTAPILGTPASGNLANCTFPTLNQSTTGNAATATAPSGGGSFITTTNIAAQSVSYATTAGNGGVSSVNGNTGAVTVSNYISSQMFAPAIFVGTVSGTTLNVTAITYGVINYGNTVFGTGLSGSPKINAYGSGGTTGTGGIGTYQLSVSQGVLSSFTMNNGTGSGTYVVPSNVSGLKITASGGGGGGGGARLSSGGSNGGTGGTTSFGSYMTVTGGAGGVLNGSAGANGTCVSAIYGLNSNFINTDGSGGGFGNKGSGGSANGYCCTTNYGGAGGISVTSVSNVTPPSAGTLVTVTVGANGTAGSNGNNPVTAPTAGSQGFCLIEW